MDLLINIIQVASAIIIVLATLVGGFWTLYRFKKLREVKKALTIEIMPTVHHQNSFAVVEIKIDFLSSGTVPVYVPYEGSKKCLLHAQALPVPKKDTALSLNDKQYQELVPAIEYFNHYSLQPGEHLILEPGVKSEVHGYGVLFTKRKGLILLHAEFYDEDDYYWTEGTIIDTRQ